MKIALVSAEVTPFAKVGGLGDISGALPIGWERLGHTSIVIIPKYRGIEKLYPITKTDIKLSLKIFGAEKEIAVWTSTLPNANVPVYFIESDDLYDRSGIYGNPDGYPDNDERFFVLCASAFELMIELEFKPDIISAHDYHTALLLPLLRKSYAEHRLFTETKGVLTIHNAQYQGWYDVQRMKDIDSWNIDECELNGSFNALKVGLDHADLIIAVSPNYAKEILTPEFGEGLEHVYAKYSEKLIGILNGVDYSSWNPESDAFIHQLFSIEDLTGKILGRNSLIEQSFHDSNTTESLPLIGMVSRFTDQKGIDLLEGCIEEFLEKGAFRFIVLGSGDERYQSYFKQLESKYPQMVSYTQGYNESLAHHILAYSDFFLLPSRFEPCGLTQLYALKYGTIPIVRSVGGLKDSVQPFDMQTHLGDGITFQAFEKEALLNALNEAIQLYHNAELMSILRHNAMLADFPIEKTALQYIKAFEKILPKH